VTLELNQLTQTAEEMGQELAQREQSLGLQLTQARDWLVEFREPADELVRAAPDINAAVPIGEPLDYQGELPDPLDQFTVIGADGTQIQPDRHGMLLYYLINIGSLVYRHGSGQTPEARSIPYLGYREDDLYEGHMLVSGNLLDVRRDHAELKHLADLVEQEEQDPVLALVDGTLLLWVLDNLPPARRQDKIADYLKELGRIRDAGAAVAAFTSRPRYADVVNLLYLASLGGDVDKARSGANPLGRLPDRALFAHLGPGHRSAVFTSHRDISRLVYGEAGCEIHLFYVNVAVEGERPVIGRVEMPAWVAQDPALLGLVHSGVVVQSRIAGGFPYVLARADELAFISGPEREQLEEMVATALYSAGLMPELSPKADYKGMTRQRRWW
jgi:hypothetical protein